MAYLDSEKVANLLRVVILVLISVVAISSRLFSVIRFESIIHEFDPWFNYRTTQYLVENGFYEFWNWFDSDSWYPLGRVVGGTLYPGIMVTSATIYKVLQVLGIPLDIREVCVFLAPVFSSFTAIAAYLLTNEVKGPVAGLLAAAFMGIAPGYISRSVAGSYDNEAIAIFLLVFTFYLWLKSVHKGSMLLSCTTALFYFYMVSAWGGYVFIINMIPLHVFTLLAMGRYSNNLYISYSTFYVIGTLASMQIPFVGFQPTFTSEHMASLGTFGLLQLVAFSYYLNSLVSKKTMHYIIGVGFSVIVALMGLALVYLTMTKKIAPWAGRFYSMWDTGYAKIHVPIIASVSEHQPTVWTSFFMDLNILIWLFPVGIYFTFSTLTDNQVFLIIYAVFGSYFAGVMVRLILTLTPIVCILAAIGVSEVFNVYLDFRVDSRTLALKQSSKSESNKEPSPKASSEPSKVHKMNVLNKLARLSVVLGFSSLLILFQFHSTWVTSNAYSSPSVVLASSDQHGNRNIIDDFREGYTWLNQNTDESAKIMSWWDYGYQLAGMANRTTLVDNNTWNNTHIATVGKILASNEKNAHRLVKELDIDYILIIYGGMLGYSGDDINKFLWMIRIGQNIYPEDLKEELFYNSQGQYAIGDNASPRMKECIMHKMSYYRTASVMGPNGMDRARRQKLPSSVTLEYFEEVFTSENWMVRLYKPKDFDNLDRLPPV
ncbi:Dolichyl-diphosphooligosaccharide-protein glycosyltransferase subunit stt3 [Smittium mucronatum]|uniref:dolichyl-diphosphooligosaccharide--protein glycotransferase n=1 Tax=Smittium mucronatum TaxID=133383 RepID=A0A1R0GV66_9FUNG|nr:Dolichyl-diphosphooligosaccharide-protein glycosyltransferase subunit stt3 [Smittium mucronatum]